MKHPIIYWTLEQRRGKWHAAAHHRTKTEGGVPQAELTSTLRQLNGKRPWKPISEEEQVEPLGGTWAVWR